MISLLRESRIYDDENTEFLSKKEIEQGLKKMNTKSSARDGSSG